MASIIAHPFIALALSPLFRRRGMTAGLGVIGAMCTIIPDLDVIGLRIGVPYDSLFGHRGFSHSLVFAAILAAALALMLRRRTKAAPAGAMFVFLFLCTASHGVLDAMTNGGLGVAFFSPFSNTRYFFPWQPIAVSPLSLARFFSGRGWAVLSSELLWVMLPSLAVFTAARFAGRFRSSPPAPPRP